VRSLIAIIAILLGITLPGFARADDAEEAAGREIFNHCVACRALEPGKQGFGPDLHGVVGRAAASLPTFEYSQALKNSKIIWTEDNLRKWMSGNDAMIPGTRMRHVSITDKVEQDYLLAFLKSLDAPARDYAKEAEVLLSRAVDKLNHDGPETAFAAFNQHSGEFVNGELYVFVFTMKGKYMASGANPGLVGQDAYNLKDAEGKYIVRSMINVVNAKSAGSVSYVWLNRADNKVERKRSFVQRVGDYIVGVGYYLE
jgi:cytochrome c